MWDTTKDYRLLVAEKSIDLFLKAITSGSFKGHWKKNESKNIIEELRRDFKSISYSYLEIDDLIKSSQIDDIEEKHRRLVDALGGEEWSRLFHDKAKREELAKVEENTAKVKFFLNILSGLRGRLATGAILDPIVGIDIVVGEIMSVSKHPNAENLMITNVKVADKAVKVITNDLEVKEGNSVAIAMLPPSTFMGITSEGMFLGAGEGILKDVQGESGKMPKGIPLESLNETRNLIEGFLNS
ncbi:MAG: tRNA-binding protein [Methanobacteriaceae archaeon]